MDDLPLLEEADGPVLDERLIAEEESRADSRDTPMRQTPIIQSIHCGCYLGRMVDVKLAARRLWNAQFDPKVSQPASQPNSLTSLVRLLSHCAAVLCVSAPNTVCWWQSVILACQCVYFPVAR